MYTELLIKLGVSITMILFGINQMIKPSAWFDYVPEWVHKMSPISPSTQMRLHALGNIVFGLYFILDQVIPNPIIAGWVVLIWWLTILPFAFRKNWAIGMRDLTIILSIGAYLFLVM